MWHVAAGARRTWLVLWPLRPAPTCHTSHARTLGRAPCEPCDELAYMYQWAIANAQWYLVVHLHGVRFGSRAARTLPLDGVACPQLLQSQQARMPRPTPAQSPASSCSSGATTRGPLSTARSEGSRDVLPLARRACGRPPAAHAINQPIRRGACGRPPAALP